ncbi:MAG: NAD(P)-dependent oxidoreductase [Litorilinea sp.]
MNIAITGGSGRIGRYVVREFAHAGYAVTNFDLQRAPHAPGDFLQVDMTDAGQVYQALARTKAEAVVHLGAWPNAGMVPDTRTYTENVAGAYHLFQACADLGIKRVISASTNQIYGFAAAPPVYAPVDEDHPLRPVNCYALSKMAGEQAAAYFVANYGMDIFSFRFMGVRLPEEIAPEIDAMASDPASGSWLLWTRTDARDAATACRQAIESADAPSGPYNITGPQVVLDVDTVDLIRTHFGNATELRGDLSGRTSPLSCARAAQAFGYRPQYSWSQSQHYPV